MRELAKPAGKRCKYQSFAKGCKIYDKRPNSCRLWSCRWLTGQDTADLPRPDHGPGYIIDPVPDFIVLDDECGNRQTMEVVQVWVTDASVCNDPKLRAYMRRRGAEGIATLIRINSTDAITIFPPEITGSDWVKRTGIAEPEHSMKTVLDGLRLAELTRVEAEQRARLLHQEEKA